MKFMTVIGLSWLTFNCFAQSETCAYYTRQCPSKFATYNDATKAIDAQVKRKEITELKGAQQVSDLARQMFPQDALLLSIVMQQATLARVAALSNLSPAQKDDLDKAAAMTYSAALIERFAFLDAAKETGAEMARIQTRAAPQEVVYVNGGNQGLNDAIPTALFLNKVGNTFATSFGQNIMPMTTCNSWGAAGVKCY